jgi:hypothetical protein
MHFGTWDYGTATVPFRYRFAPSKSTIISQSGNANSAISAPSESDATLGLGIYFGRKWGDTWFYEDPSKTTNTVSIEITLITGPTLIPLSLSNVDSSSKYVGYLHGYNYTGPTNIIAWSVAPGMVFQWKTINFGLYGGIELPLARKVAWVYADKLWLGFGIGVNLGMLSSGNSVN